MLFLHTGEACLRRVCCTVGTEVLRSCRATAAAQLVHQPYTPNAQPPSEACELSRFFCSNAADSCGPSSTSDSVCPQSFRGPLPRKRWNQCATLAAPWSTHSRTFATAGSETQAAMDEPESNDPVGDASFIDDTLQFHNPESTAGETTWNLIWDGEEDGEEGEEDLEVWECDFTGGAIPNNDVNSLLSNKAKWEIHDTFKDNPEQ
mmetsp:Transcript_29896/g.84294  ORF Transcript_29896/g.84294 Transcript_29896/m.84294 type:complete len:205 (-) Transcript_29896:1750-2364(-)|eukprot:CAMPEP_0117652676 /NCGR_PEP_ID=MMETSP0804-20121206/2762_1 /TAXON_ID=1074897 /ORGANISM="Tetraselmis astigmatica, Strain CCMP880" /LENGTH=204 /DNA_ID=CAMNT_0005458755 /DNA_START=41 /DNA_END=655 /DNA_ORIENTATION=-